MTFLTQRIHTIGVGAILSSGKTATVIDPSCCLRSKRNTCPTPCNLYTPSWHRGPETLHLHHLVSLCWKSHTNQYYNNYKFCHAFCILCIYTERTKHPVSEMKRNLETESSVIVWFSSQNLYIESFRIRLIL